MMSRIMHVADNRSPTSGPRHMVCGLEPRATTRSRTRQAFLTLILAGTSNWYSTSPRGLVQCKKCVKKLAKDYPEVLLAELGRAAL
jgi:hypothetical protein